MGDSQYTKTDPTLKHSGNISRSSKTLRDSKEIKIEGGIVQLEHIEEHIEEIVSENEMLQNGGKESDHENKQNSGN